jgi:hypothetical protein
MVELRRQTGKVTDPVIVAVSERFDVELVENGVFVPERIGGSVHRHRVGASGSPYAGARTSVQCRSACVYAKLMRSVV